MTIFGTAGDDDLDGTVDGDDFDMSQGGHDFVRGMAGNDQFLFGSASFDALDQVFGGKGNDALLLSGAYDVIFRSKTIRGIEQLYLDDGFDYRFVFHDGNVAPGHTLYVNANILTGTHRIQVYGGDETDGKFLVDGATGDDDIRTGKGDDILFGHNGDDFIAPGEGHDAVDAGDGDDTIVFGADLLHATDAIVGGAGQDTVLLAGDYSGGTTLGMHMLSGVEHIQLYQGFDYVIDAGTLVLDGVSMIFDGSALSAANTFHFDASAVTSGATFLEAWGGAGDDVLSGSNSRDRLIGFGGTDLLTGNKGNDTYSFVQATDSTGAAYDTIIGFDAHRDIVEPQFGQVMTVFPKVKNGELSTAHFNHDLEAAIGPDELSGAAAVLFTPDQGTLAGSLFLIVNANGEAGYQANEDLVVLFDHARHMGDFSILNFGT